MANPVFSVTKSKIFVEDKCYGFIGGAIDSFSGNNVNVTSKTKNKDLQKQIDAALASYSDVKGAGDAALSDYIAKYLGQAKDSSVRSQQEIGTEDQFYNGQMAGQLAQLRASRTKALTNAANRSSSYALANSNRSRLNDEGGGSSYNTRLLARNVQDIQTSAAVDESNQERSDLGYVTGNQLALTGKRNEIANAEAGYGLVPQQVRAQMYQQNLGQLGSLGQLDQMNKFYGLKQDRSPWANFFDAADQGIMNGVSIAGSVMKMSKGGDIEGPGTETSDSIPARLSDGEFVVRAAAVKLPGVRRALEIINALGHDNDSVPKENGPHLPKHYAWGGMVRSDVARVKKKTAKPKGYAEGGDVGGGGMEGGGMDLGNGNVGQPDPWFDSPYGASFWGGSGNGDSNDPNKQPQPKKKQESKPSGGGGNDLAAGAMGLQAREDRATGPGQFMPTNYGVPELTDPNALLQIYMNAAQPSFWGKS